MSGDVLHLSDGAVYGFIRRFSKKIQPDIDAIETVALNQNVYQTDATSESDY